MVIGHKHKYLFIEIPYTASTAISRELREHYDGQLILQKHALYSEFRRIASPEERDYFVFAGVRNPLDAAVSIYFKFKSNHNGKFTDPKRLAKGNIASGGLARFNFIKPERADFTTYCKRYHRLPYGSLINVAYKHCDFVIRFESLQEDFSKALQLMGAEQKRPLPRVNKTSGKQDDFLSYYTPEIIEQAKRVFGPFMKQWGYDFPPDWGDNSIPWRSQMEYRVVDAARNFYWQYLRWGPYASIRSLIYRIRSIPLRQALQRVFSRP